MVTPLRSIHPPSEIRRSRISIGKPGAQVICSTGLLRSSHVVAVAVFACFFLSSAGLPSGPSSGIGRRAR